MSMMGSAHPAGPAVAADWITINGVDVNMAQVASILWNPSNNNVRAHVRMATYDPERDQADNTVLFVVTDAATADELRAYVAAHRPLGHGQDQGQGQGQGQERP